MLLAALVLSLQPALPLAPAVQSEIVVIGAKLKTWKARLVTKHDSKTGLTTTRCTTVRSTKDAQIDAIACAALQTCSERLRPRILATADRKTPAAERKLLRRTVNRDFGSCVMSERDTRIADLADSRWHARQGTTNAPN